MICYSRSQVHVHQKTTIPCESGPDLLFKDVIVRTVRDLFRGPFTVCRDGNGSDLDRVQVDPDPDPFSGTGSKSGTGSAGPVLQDPDPDPRILRIQYWIRVQNGSDLFCFFFVFLNVLRLQ